MPMLDLLLCVDWSMIIRNVDFMHNTLYWEALPIYTIYQLCILESNQESSQQIISIDQNHLSSDKIVSKKLLCLTNIPHIYPTAFCITFNF